MTEREGGECKIMKDGGRNKLMKERYWMEKRDRKNEKER